MEHAVDLPVPQVMGEIVAVARLSLREKIKDIASDSVSRHGEDH